MRWYYPKRLIYNIKYYFTKVDGKHSIVNCVKFILAVR